MRIYPFIKGHDKSLSFCPFDLIFASFPHGADRCFHGYLKLGGGSPACFLCTPQLLWQLGACCPQEPNQFNTGYTGARGEQGNKDEGVSNKPVIEGTEMKERSEARSLISPGSRRIHDETFSHCFHKHECQMCVSATQKLQFSPTAPRAAPAAPRAPTCLFSLCPNQNPQVNISTIREKTDPKLQRTNSHQLPGTDGRRVFSSGTAVPQTPGGGHFLYPPPRKAEDS